LNFLLSILAFSAYMIGDNFVENEHDEEKQHVLEIQFSGVKSDLGNIMVAVYAGEDGFLDESKAIRKIVIPADDHSKLKQFKLPLKTGRYAIAVFHDTNGNGKLDRNWFSYPTEPFGFSNGASASFGPPSFGSASVLVDKDMAIEIKLS
jgi:uncharacterized protein (DUF2141 family)